MKVTDVQIRLMPGSEETLRAVCSITFDGKSVVTPLRDIDGPHGLFVAMPASNRLQLCSACSRGFEVKAGFCPTCGWPVPRQDLRPANDPESRQYTVIAHPITPECREEIETAVLAPFDRELNAALQQDFAGQR